MPPHDMQETLNKLEERLDSIDKVLSNHVTELSKCQGEIKKDVDWLKWLVKGAAGAATAAMFMALGSIIVDFISRGT